MTELSISEPGYPVFEDIQTISTWIGDYVRSSGYHGVVIGLSGGLDSSIVAFLSAMAVGKTNVLGILLPCYGPEQDETDAMEVVDVIGMNWIVHSIVHDFDMAWSRYPHPFKQRLSPKKMEILKGNLRARLRMAALYTYAGGYNRLNIGTGNASELAIGYITKFGDGGVDLEPLGNWYKTEIKIMAASIPNFPQKIIDKAPSAGLWDGQTDEHEIGMSYDKLDPILKYLANTPSDQIWDDPQIDNAKLHSILDLINANKHKGDVPPCCPRTSSLK